MVIMKEEYVLYKQKLMAVALNYQPVHNIQCTSGVQEVADPLLLLLMDMADDEL